MRRLTSVTVVSVLAIGGAIPTPATAAAATDGEIWQRTFRSMSISEYGQPRDLVPGTRLRIAFSASGMVNATAGCGDIVSTVETQGDRLIVGAVDVRPNGCVAADRQRQDHWLAGLLALDPHWGFDGDDLVLTVAGTELRLTDRPDVATDPPLAGTYWVMESVVDGGEVIEVPEFPQPYLVLSDGQLVAHNGCNWISGAAAVSVKRVTFSDLGYTKRFCTGYSFLLEIKIQTVLANGDVTYRIEAGRLVLTRPGGPELRLRSES